MATSNWLNRSASLIGESQDASLPVLLVVDDEQEITTSLADLFRRNYRVLTAASAAEALTLLKEHDVSVILADQRMPEMSGAELLADVSLIDEDIVRILMTGYADIEAVVQAVNDGKIFFYLTKPWRMEELNAVIAKAFAHHNLIREKRRLLDELGRANAELEARIAERTAEISGLNRTLRTISECNLALFRAADEAELLNEICAIVVETGGYPLAWVGYAQHDVMKSVRPVAQAGFEDGYLEKLLLTWSDTEHGRGPIGTAIRTGQQCLAHDVLTDPNFYPWRAEVSKLGYRSVLALPLKQGDQVFGALTIYSRVRGAFDQEELKLLSALAEKLAYGITVARTRRAREEGVEALRAAKTRYARAVRGTSDGIWDWNIQTGEDYHSPRYKELLGYAADEYDDTLEAFDSIVHPDDLAMALAARKAHLERREPYDIELRLRTGRGDYRWFRSRGQAEWDADGTPLRMAGSITDITDRKRVERELVIAKEQAENANAAKSMFLANMSHEIRTPLNGIIGMAQLLEYTTLSEEQREYLDAIKTSSEILLELINDVLDLSRIESGKIELERRDFSLRHSISDVIRAQISLINSKGLGIEIDIPADVPDNLTGDQLRLKQILLNLLSNAVKFTTAGSIRIAAGISDRIDNIALVKLTVTDTGIGISPETMKKIFAPFVQADVTTARMYGGTGLGLAICTKLAELMGGRVWAESREGCGSSFFLQLPCAINEAVVGEHNRRSGDKTPPRTADRSLRVLVAEDQVINLRFTTRLLQRAGHTVVVARNGREALQRWEQDTFDIILMDIEMPVMNGVETTQAIRMKEHEQGGHIPIIAVTARALQEEREMIMAQGFDGCLTKPLEIDALLSEMQRCLPAG